MWELGWGRELNFWPPRIVDCSKWWILRGELGSRGSDLTSRVHLLHSWPGKTHSHTSNLKLSQPFFIAPTISPDCDTLENWPKKFLWSETITGNPGACKTLLHTNVLKYSQLFYRSYHLFMLREKLDLKVDQKPLRAILERRHVEHKRKARSKVIFAFNLFIDNKHFLDD